MKVTLFYRKISLLRKQSFFVFVLYAVENDKIFPIISWNSHNKEYLN